MTISNKEIERQYRVLQQTLSMHCSLRDSYQFRSTSSQIIILISSAIICATTFASDDLYITLGLSPNKGSIFMGIAGVLAFAFSLALLVLDWAGQAAKHSDAAKRYTSVLEKFRTTRLNDSNWPEDQWISLSEAYWEANNESIEIPGKLFNKLKAEHLRKCNISQMKSKYPGCPRIILWVILRVKHTMDALKDNELTNRD